MALVRAGFPVLMFTQDRTTRAPASTSSRHEFAARGAKVLLAGRQRGRRGHAAQRFEAHPVIEPMLCIQSFYRRGECAARRAA